MIIKKDFFKEVFFEIIGNYLLSKQIANGRLFIFPDQSL
jgi:hypothetical protein